MVCEQWRGSCLRVRAQWLPYETRLTGGPVHLWRKTVVWVQDDIWIILVVLFLIGVTLALVLHYTWNYGWAFATRLRFLY